MFFKNNQLTTEVTLGLDRLVLGSL